MKEMKN